MWRRCRPGACRELYGLDCLAASVQDQGNNFTRFICIAKNLEIYPGADRTSLMMVLPHTPVRSTRCSRVSTRSAST